MGHPGPRRGKRVAVVECIPREDGLELNEAREPGSRGKRIWGMLRAPLKMQGSRNGGFISEHWPLTAHLVSTHEYAVLLWCVHFIGKYEGLGIAHYRMLCRVSCTCISA